MGTSGQLKKGIELAISGAWQQAESLFRQAIERQPDYPEAYYNLGLIYRRTNRLDEAEICLERAIELKADYSEAHYILGLIFQESNRLNEAAASFYCAIKLDSAWADAYYQLGLVLKHINRLDGAEACLRRVIELNPNDAKAYNNLGMILNVENHLDAAQECFCRAIELKPDYTEAYNNLGVVQARRKLLEEAVKLFRYAIELQPDNPYTCNNLGLNLKELDRRDEAQDCFRRAIRINPHYAEAHHNLGLALKEAGCLDEAERCIRRAIGLKPDFTLAYNNLVAILAVANRLEEAEECIRQSVRLKPDSSEAHRRLGLILKMKHRLDEAEASYRRAIDLSPPTQRAEPCFALGILHLLRGQFATGWENYELRRKIFEYPEPPIRYWQGEDLAERRILLFFEQGLGDTIHFIRYARKVTELAAETVVWVQRPLERLLVRSSSCRIYTGTKMPLEKFDFACSLHSLPGLFYTSQQKTISQKVPYLWPGNNVSAKWRKALDKADGGRLYRIGVVWAGNPRHDNDRNRSVPFSVFSKLFAMAQVSWVSLQVGDRAGDLSGTVGNVADLSRELTDFSETAGVIANLDLVVSVDSAVAHLAGAMGKPTWLLLPFNPDWRWQLDREDSPWYPTMRLFRQDKPGDWRRVLEKVGMALLRI